MNKVLYYYDYDYDYDYYDYYYYCYYYFHILTPACGYINKATHFVGLVYLSSPLPVHTDKYTVWQNAMLTKNKEISWKMLK